jgi:UPF0755 protein
MNDDPRARWEDDNRRNERIRELRAQRQTTDRRPSRRFQPVILILWFAGVAAFAAVVIFVGFLAFAPRLMSWVESNPGMIKQGIVLDFVRWYQPDALADVPASTDGARVTVKVPTGATDGAIGQLLAQKGIVRSQLTFEYWVIQAGREGSLQAGVYDLSPGLTPSEIVGALRQEAGQEVAIRIGEGWRLEQIVGYLSTTKLTMNLDEFTKLIKDPPADLLAKYPIFANLPVGRTLEGYLFPDTYRVDANSTPRQLVEKLLDNFNKRLTPQIRKQIATHKINGRTMTIDQAVILASIVEREAQKAAERPLIAGVYLNRLTNPSFETGGLLQADPTLQYAVASDKYLLGDKPAPISGWQGIKWWAPLDTGGAQVSITAKALARFQTYKVAGLPPWPIDGPGLASLQAVATANTGAGYYYFVAACPGGKRDGSHYFAKSYAQQLANIAKANGECPAA